MKEGLHYDKKSLKKVVGKTADFDDLARHCVAFANARGGTIDIGIEDRETTPPANQKIADELPHEIDLRISQLTINAGTRSVKKIASNGGEYIVLTIDRNVTTFAGTSDGRYFVRVGDQSKAIYPDQLYRLLTDKASFAWESQIVPSMPRNSYDKEKAKQFYQDIQDSKKASPFVKEKSLEELLTYYKFVDGKFLTNLGVLWLGTQPQRLNIPCTPRIQFIKYDHYGEKVNKIVWHDQRLNPKELLNAVVEEIPDWNEGVEISDGIYRRVIPNYGKDVIRELVANAIFHKPYTIGGDIFINLYHDYLEIHNPGLLPVGVTPENILQKSVRRNEIMCALAMDLSLMEKEGTGIDKVYEELLSLGKQTPTIEERMDRVVVTVERAITKPEVILFIEMMTNEYSLKRKERIALGLIAQHEAISALELTKILALDGRNPTRSWLDRLIEFQIVVPIGKTKDRKYRINPDFVRKAQLNTKTTLSNIQPHRLKELIMTDLKMYPNSGFFEIHQRIGAEIIANKLRKVINKLIDEGEISKTGAKKITKYFILQKGVE